MSFTKIALTALAFASVATAAPIKNCARDKPSSYDESYLESYETYHTRYLALSCYTQHNTTFFDDCCHPLLTNETLADARLSYCNPNATQLAAVNSTEAASAATASATNSADLEAASAYSEVSSSVWTASATETVSSSASETASSAVAVADVAQISVSVSLGLSIGNEQTSTSSEVEPTTSSSSSYVEPTTASSTSTSSSSAASASSTSEVYTGGYATFYSQGSSAGECGDYHSDDDYVIAIDSNGWWSDYESNDSSPYCGKSITLTNTNNGKSVTAVVADVCPSCTTSNSLDLSVAAFNAIASEDDGMVPITWFFSS
ncbi:hypothetical protein, variant [Cryptococcus amylolentus CBS 6039]|uniref:RlpA-like protein double-psi beta-barrel domain-containing protein n=1 Tax=Cryptococcus amylolentus CBS 6039 TaxID=1295533 RepID=A0A1E3HJX5_9TREE|nr:hypothetical protein L202_05286 [Cryptococcus amylolentus CBS 6039]XP_018992014.1 hypothetical protein, variant [Cryptococcus amylolentus CBS 6039]ODN76639.1 hypothetical protein L202_05286 [Cryptococcus amylolentus CBS 6039]ODN76640.1 hypothetical protein, variant [Cryptococcus amylolentus CBS 6039]